MANVEGMCDDAILALDLGTSGCRAEVFALEGVSLGWAYEEYELLSPEPGAAEQDAEGWWRALVRCARKALSDCRAGARTPPAVITDILGRR
ncbi:MAG: FGGY family carbohydrate kinase [Armatimonadia bacterium]